MTSLKRRKQSPRSNDWPLFLLVSCITLVPLGLALTIQVSSVQPDFSKVTIGAADDDSPPLLAWKTLQSLATGQHAPVMQALGYMMDTEGHRIENGASAHGFVLMPD